MEYGLWPEVLKGHASFTHVLILVLMEYGLWRKYILDLVESAES